MSRPISTTDMVNRFRVGQSVVSMSTDGDVEVGKCLMATSKNTFTHAEHSRILIEGCCTRCWERSYNEALDDTRRVIDNFDDRPRIKQENVQS